MSSLLRPVGHLPASVYWFRRGLVLAVLVVLIILISNLFGGGGDAQNAAASDPQQDPTTAPPAATTTPTSTATTSATTSATKKPTTTPTPTKTTPPTDLPCKGSDLTVTALPANRKIVSGSMLNFVVQLNPTGDGCKASTDNLTVTVTSGKDLIWSTTQCEKVIQNATLVVAKGKQAAVTVPWNGHRSRPGCLPGQPVAKPGTYVVKAEYDGRPSGAQAFLVV